MSRLRDICHTFGDTCLGLLVKHYKQSQTNKTYLDNIASSTNHFCFRIAEILDGKGGGKKGKFQGRANKLSRRSEAEKLLRDYIGQPKETEQ